MTGNAQALLNETEVRVVGSLVEKQVTTPDYYPLTLNALVAACKQISNRDPVVAYDERTVADAIDTLRSKNLVYVFYGADSRVPKYKHMLREALDLTAAQLAVMCVLMLRGPQTVGEIRGRTGRLHEFADLAEVETTLDELSRRDDGPLVVKLPRQPGRKDSRYAQTLAGVPEVTEEAAAAESASEPRRRAGTDAGGERVARLEAEVESLRREVDEMRRQFEEFKRQFE
ncbi:MAG TPA: YceH family protein [Pyrinomonadaceae bacterium]|nr:YceH family protein [Pyrinomonadaceae bacterium]